MAGYAKIFIFSHAPSACRWTQRMGFPKGSLRSALLWSSLSLLVLIGEILQKIKISKIPRCLWRGFLLLFGTLLLSACAKTNDIYINTPEGHRRALIQTFAAELAEEGGQLVQVGDTVRIIFPGDVMLNYCSMNINPHYRYLLNDTAQLMRKLETISVKVSGYTNCKPTYALNKSLSKRQSEVIAEYLFECGLDARLVHTAGYASQDPIVMPESAEENRRVEVLFQYLPLARPY